MRSKLTTPEDAVRLIEPGMTLGMGGFSNSRKCMVMVQSLLRAGTDDLTLVGTNLSIDLDILSAMGQVTHAQCGTGNLERYGVARNFRRGIEDGSITVEDHSHLGISLRLTAGELGLPFIPIRSWRGSDLETYSTVAAHLDDPFSGEDTLVLKPLIPDVALLHVQRADVHGTAEIMGCTFHERELIRASEHAVVVCEELVDEDYFRDAPEHATVPYTYVDAVVHAPFGAHPTAVYRYYDNDEPFLRAYQKEARKGNDASRAFIREHILDHDTHEAYLEQFSELDGLRADEELGY